jgi:hypothetical protein
MISLAAGERKSSCKSRACRWDAQIEHAPHLEMMKRDSQGCVLALA